jgi:septum formation protein
VLILASGSPRRKELLSQVGIAYMVDPSSFEEETPKHKDPEKYVQAQALGKACDIAVKYHDQWVLGADTVVAFDGKILGKPKSEEDAFTMLKQLSGHKHSVFTGIALVNGNQKIIRVVETKVWFRKISDREIQRYIATGEPMDKAGAYGIQGKAAGFVDKINGSYTNVVGLPLAQVYKMLKKAKVDL